MNRKSFFSFLFLFGALIGTTGCGADGFLVKPAPAAAAPVVLPDNQPILLAAPDATVTPTPFLPQGSSGQGLPLGESGSEGSRPWGKYAGPSIWPPIDIPPPAPEFPETAGYDYILLLGDDKLDDPSFRTDAIMLLILKKDTAAASIVSFPRDLYVYVPGWTMQRINMVMERGGFSLMAETFSYNFGVRPTYYAQLNLYTMGRMIDALDGIDVDVPIALKDPDYGVDIPVGRQHMDGNTAQLYTQARYTTSDFDRTRRQQEVLQAIFLKMISLNGLTRVPELYQTFQQDVKTNITMDDVTRWLPLAASMQDFSRLQRYSINEEHVTPWVIPTSGTDVLLPNRNAILTTLQMALGIGRTTNY